jgi:ketosteroid isomerase-like protein
MTSTLAPVRPASADYAVYSLLGAIGAGTLDGAVACFTREGCLVTPDGTAVHGRDGIRSLISQMIASRTEIEVEQLVLRRAGDVVLGTGRMTMRFSGPEGSRVTRVCEPMVVLRLVEEWWKVAILAPWSANRPVT